MTHESTYEYHQPSDEQLATLKALRQAAMEYSAVLEKLLPDGPDKTWIIRNHRTTAMWANVAATRQPDGTPRT